MALQKRFQVAPADFETHDGVTKREHARQIVISNRALRQLDAHAEHVLHIEVGAEGFADGVAHEVVVSVIVAALHEIVGRHAHDAPVAPGDALPVAVQHLASGGIFGNIGGDGNQLPPIGDHLPAVRIGIAPEGEVQPSQFAAPLERLYNQRAAQVGRVFFAPLNKSRLGQARMRVSADNHIDARHFTGEALVVLVPQMRDENHQVRLRAQLGHELARRLEGV